MKKIALIFAFVCFGLVAGATDLPEVVVKALAPYGGQAAVDSFDTYEEDGVTYYDIIILNGENEIELIVDQNGMIVEIYGDDEKADSDSDW